MSQSRTNLTHEPIPDEPNSISNKGETVKLKGQDAGGHSSPSYTENDDEMPLRWSWGAFGFGGLWGIINGVPLYALEFVLFAILFKIGWDYYSTFLWIKWNLDSRLYFSFWIMIHLVIRFFFGINGLKRSWKTARKKEVNRDSFVLTQKAWNRGGSIITILGIILFVLIIGIIFGIGFTS